MIKKYGRRPGRLFQKLLRILPDDFREEFGGEMEEVFEEQLQEACHRRGSARRLKTWCRAFADVIKTALREHLSRAAHA